MRFTKMKWKLFFAFGCLAWPFVANGLYDFYLQRLGSDLAYFGAAGTCTIWFYWSSWMAFIHEPKKEDRP